MAIEFSCESCGRHYRVRDRIAGRYFSCQNCQKRLRVPGTAIAQNPRAEALAPRAPAEPDATDRSPAPDPLLYSVVRLLGWLFVIVGAVQFVIFLIAGLQAAVAMNATIARTLITSSITLLMTSIAVGCVLFLLVEIARNIRDQTRMTRRLLASRR